MILDRYEMDINVTINGYEVRCFFMDVDQWSPDGYELRSLDGYEPRSPDGYKLRSLDGYEEQVIDGYEEHCSPV